MEKTLLTLLGTVCVVSLPFVLKGSGKTNIGKHNEKVIEELEPSLTKISEQKKEDSFNPLEQPSPTNKRNQLLTKRYRKKMDASAGPDLRENLLVFFSKGVLATFIDSFAVTSKKVKYPVRPFPKVFKTNIIYDLLFFPILSVVWVKMSYNNDLGKILLKSLIISVPMSAAQWCLERKTNLIKWHKWSTLHTFGYICFTLFTIRGFIGLTRSIDHPKLIES